MLSVVRVPVVAILVVAVLGVAGVLVWGGGEAPTSASPSAAGGPSADAAFGGFGDGDAAGGSGSAGVGGGTSVPPPPFNPADVVPVAGAPVTPTESRALLAWRVESRDWTSVLSSYQGFLAADGYRLGEQRISTTDGDTGAPKGGAWDIVPDQGGPQSAIGLLYIGPAPDDPADTIVEVEVS